MSKIITFNDALHKSDGTIRNLLLGNGFSIACDSGIFNYKSLYANAEVEIKNKMPEVSQLFNQSDLKDFEEIIRTLNHSLIAMPIYLPEQNETIRKMENHIDQLKKILISTIAAQHPESPSKISAKKFLACRKFLSHFLSSSNKGKVYTLNYDLLLYWALMYEDDNEDAEKIDLEFNDGFGKYHGDDSWVIWKNEDYSRDQRVYYLHGAVHLFDSGVDLEKFTWTNSGTRLIDQSNDALSQNKFPLFVAEGKSAAKLEKIKHHPYLHHSYKSFISATKESKKRTDTKKSLFIFGHSLGESDKHIIDKIVEGSFSKLFVSIYGDEEAKENKLIINKASKLSSLRGQRNPLEVNFYNAITAKVWSDE